MQVTDIDQFAKRHCESVLGKRFITARQIQEICEEEQLDFTGIEHDLRTYFTQKPVPSLGLEHNGEAILVGQDWEPRRVYVFWSKERLNDWREPSLTAARQWLLDNWKGAWIFKHFTHEESHGLPTTHPEGGIR
ncbi:hypothetical protein KUV95_12535 [Microbulbifer agarilyticus]|uniref:hypothetical protein n=1 Tax=Microbulbifer agarilyticus TaxID=260552 RepID=UPI001C93A9DD|nr:hypothetical protein [Microbulbifer agarilyticus]MBY6212378.1 hypothetical protein [Microbulbifer agarilyticus]